MRKKIQKARLIAASADESADILYAGGFHAPDEFLYFETGKTRAVIVSPLEYARAVQETKPGVEVIARTSLLREARSRDASNRSIVEILSKKYGVDQWVVPARFPAVYADQIRSLGLKLEVEPGEFFPQRRRKRREEVKAIKKAMEATENAMWMVHDMIAKAKVNSHGALVLSGKLLTSDRIRNEVEVEFKRNSFSAFRTIIAGGRQSAEPHNIGSGPIFAGQPVVADIFPRSDETGYWGDMTRTFLKGKAPEIVERAFLAVRRASGEAMKVIRPGIAASEVHRVASDVLDNAGFPTGHDEQGRPCGFFHGLGHGVGLEIHENPRVSPMNPNPLEPGNVISVEPGLYYPLWGGIRLEDLVVVTRDSFCNFCTMPKELEIP